MLEAAAAIAAQIEHNRSETAGTNFSFELPQLVEGAARQVSDAHIGDGRFGVDSEIELLFADPAKTIDVFEWDFVPNHRVGSTFRCARRTNHDRDRRAFRS